MRDSTAHQAFAQAKYDKPRHAVSCRVMGGHRLHGVAGFHCERCAADRQGS